ncbi:homeobox protein cut-like isoform X2 [Condylostylus longicornis]|uniref:homeobox protein cut-like isoform X2 n=1 Tax=Condylostylus longicornis TaxID=2530218 RepID=UPI00244DD398|nr:homeobox protein cut-like isoform X2 [Condylostylus longicornis]
MLPTAVSTTTTTTTTGGIGGPITGIDLTTVATSPTVQQPPMDWLFKKERIYWLAQFWQQKAILAEKEISTLKEQLTTTPNTESSTISDDTNELNKTSLLSSDLNNTLKSLSSLTSTSPPNSLQINNSHTNQTMLTLPPNSASILSTLPLLNGCTTNPLNGAINSTTTTTIPTLLNYNLNGNYIATAPSPSPPLSENESITSINNNHNNDKNNSDNISIDKTIENDNKIIENKLNNHNGIEIIKEKGQQYQLELDKKINEKEAVKKISTPSSSPSQIPPLFSSETPISSKILNKNDNDNNDNDDDDDLIMIKDDEIEKDSNHISKICNNRLISDNQIENKNCKNLNLDENLNNTKKSVNVEIVEMNDIKQKPNDDHNIKEIINEESLNNSLTPLQNDKICNEKNNNCEKKLSATKAIEEEEHNNNKKKKDEDEICKKSIENKNEENIICDLRNNKLKEELAFKDKEIKILSDEILRLKILYEQQILHNQRLQDELEEKLNVILRLELRLKDNTLEINKNNNSNEKNQSIQQISLPEDDDDDDDDEIIIKEEKLNRTSTTENDDNLKTSNSKLDNNLIERQQPYDTEFNNSSVRNQREKYDTTYNSEGKMDITENAANSLQQMAAAGSFSGGHISNPFQASLQFAFSTQSQDRPSFSRFSDDLPSSNNNINSSSGRYNTDLLIPKSDPMEAKLQEMLRYGLDKFANHNLDTLYISRRVRELLSVHNIGQRIFAKYILGLSQGTVSELLSKPKPWDKLTEKGRDSYRKMHAWACDDAAILLLKSLIPKKDSNMSQFGYSDERSSDDRIPTQVLTDSLSPLLSKSNIHVSTSLGGQSFSSNQKLNTAKDEDSRSNDDLRSPSNTKRCTTPSSIKESKTSSNPAIQEQSSRVDYQEDLAKIMSRNQREMAPAFPSFLFPQLYAGTPNGSLPPDMANFEIALETYHRELAKLQSRNGTSFPNFTELLALQQHQAALALSSSVQDLSINKEQAEIPNADDETNPRKDFDESKEYDKKTDLNSSDNTTKIKEEDMVNTLSSGNVLASRDSSPITNNILTPSSEEFTTSVNPLQKMASITNSLITQPPLPPLHTQPPRPLKAVLPPITQQQFDLYNNLNTEDIVRNVKEALSQYSISQRLFGENVLGLSQGSVSDLLARPKPWHMLTQKGREPFIRMKMFLEDDSAVHKLVASQYKIAPEKLMRTGNYTGTPQIPTSLASKIEDIQNTSMQKIISDLKFKQESQQQHLMQQMRAVNALANLPQHQAVTAAGMLLNQPNLMPHYATSPIIPPVAPNSNNNADVNSAPNKSPLPIVPIPSPQPANVMRSGQNQHMSPTVYEMAALTQDLDTQIITTKVKEVLLANNIGQKIFGEAVLGLSQGSVSELLSKPKPWHMLSIKGREPFIRMQLWLSDMNNIERLQTLKNEQREASKRRRSIGPAGSHDNSDTSSNDTNDFYTTSPGPGSVGSNGVPPNKKQRVLFSEEQKEALRLAFTLDPYPNVTTIEFLASELGLATRTITNWFHNHRMRLKQQMPHGQPAEPIPTRENQTGPPLDPVQFKILLNQRLMEMQKDRMGLAGVPLMYPPYFGGNSNLAALIAGRSLFPTNGANLQVLNSALKGQFNGIDLSLNNSNENNSIQQESDQDFKDEDHRKNDEIDIEDSTSLSKLENNENDLVNKNDEEHSLSGLINSNIRPSRRKAAAPQWVNPDWQPKSLFKSTNISELSDRIQNEATDFSKRSENNDFDKHLSNINDELNPNNSTIPIVPDINIKTEKLDPKENDFDDDEDNNNNERIGSISNVPTENLLKN